MEPQPIPETTRGHLSHRLSIANKLFKLISEETDIDNPMCDECSQEFVAALEKKIHDLKKEQALYDQFLKNNPETKVAKNDVELLKRRYDKAKELLIQMEAEREAIDLEFEKYEQELQELELQEQEYWRQLNSLEMEIQEHQDDLVSVNNQFELANSRLEVLSKTNVFNDTFRIWHDGPFGTINGLRLGRLPTRMVEWPEINAAIGQTALLLDTIAQRLNFTFSSYRIIPLGSFSKIEKLDGDLSVYELHGSSDFTGMLFWNRRFDLGLIAFLQCLKELGDYAESKDGRYKLPYKYILLTKDKQRSDRRLLHQVAVQPR
ncbi:autophagy protein 6 [Boothiomyces macroporosus]|uniref:Autophagy protein 6 n=1 Tax=Boothiomyces macroporosus TaxID=261099 RepID=A0AAD5UD92_9FUNG|nr:autophagy protein 6 [Boothiomyces macroporosus]